MWRSAALYAAMGLVEHPAAVRQASCSPLPSGISLLLEVAAGEAAALRSAQTMTGWSQAALQAAAGFFIEQILFHPQGDSYRIFGASPGASRSELRQHMALLMKWLHPDSRDQRAPQSDIDRGIFIHRVTRAWEDLKTDERRAAYDRSLREKSIKRTRWRPRGPAPAKVRKPKQPRNPFTDRPNRKDRFRRLIVRRFERESLLSRVFTYLGIRT